MFTEPQNWSDSVQVTQDYDYTSADGLTTKTGTAVTTFTRVKLKDVLTCPKLIFDGTFPDKYNPDTEDFDSTPGNNQFIAMQSAVGRMPGWVVTFGGFDPIKDAFTITSYSSAADPSPSVSHFDGGLGLTMTCNAVAPGRQTLPSQLSDSYFFGINNGLIADDEVTDATFDVEVVYPGYAGDDKQPPIPPVYRVTMPDDFAFVTKASVVYNGETIDLSYGLEDLLSSNLLEAMFRGVFGQIDAFRGVALAVRRVNCIDVQMASYGDTLAAGSLSYCPAVPSDAATLSAGSFTQAIDDPFHLSGQTFSSDRDEDGLKITVVFA